MKKILEKAKRIFSIFVLVNLFVALWSPLAAQAAATVITIDPLAPTNNLTPTITGTIDSADDVRIDISGPGLSLNDLDAIEVGNNWSYSGTIFPGDGDYTIVAWTVGSAGNLSDTATLTIDTTAPIVTEVVPVPDPTNDSSPDYTFNSNEAGTIIYGGDCSSSTTTAVAGDNSVTFNTLTDGLHDNCTITVEDQAGNLSAPLSVSQFTVDTIAPVVSGVVNGSYYNTDVTPTYNEGTAVLKYSGNTDPFPSGTVVSDEDLYVLEVVDAAGNETVVVFVIDKTAPVITLNGDNPMVVERGDTFSDPGAYTDTGEAVTTSGSPNMNVIGDYVITYNAVDLAGNAATPVERIVQVRDTVSPTVDAGPDRITNETIFQDATASDFPFAISSYLWEQISGPGTLSFSPDANREDVLMSADVDGVYTARLTATDAGSNTASDTMQLTWDTTAPDVNVGGSVTTNSPYFIDAFTSDNLTNIVSYSWSQDFGPGVIAFSDPNAEDTWAIASVDGIYSISLTVEDEAGNVSSDSLLFIWDTNDPTVNNVIVSVDYNPYVDGNGFDIKAEVSDSLSGINGSTCEYTIDGVNWSPANYNALNQECYVNGVTAADGQSLTINFRVNDSAGNLGTGSAIARTSDAASPDVTLLDVVPTSGAYTSANPQLVGTITDTVSSVVSCEYDYRENGGAWNGWQAGNLVAGTCTANLSSLNNGSTYDFRMRGTDEVGHIGGETTVVTRIVDNTPPVINPPLSDVVTNSVTTGIDATTSDADSDIASWTWTVESQPVGSVAVFSDPNAEDTNITVDTDGEYILRLTVVDNVGNSVYDEMTLILDRVDPTVGQANVIVDYDPYVRGDFTGFDAWANVSDDRSGVDTSSCRYTLDDGGTWTNVGAYYLAGQCRVDGLTASDGAALTIKFMVYDNAGNDAEGASITRTVDSNAPNFSNLTVTPDTTVYTSANPSVSVNVTDTVSPVTSCEYDVRENGGAWAGWQTANLSGDQCTFDLSNLNDGSEYDINIRAFDSVGHESTTMFTRKVDDTAPVVDAGSDIRTNVQTLLDATATDSASGISAYSWTQVSGPGILAFVSPDQEDTLVSADADGVYVAKLTVTDAVGNSSSDMVQIDWDTKVNTAKNLVANAGDGEVRLEWDNPTDSDLAKIDLYRSTDPNDEGSVIATLYPGTEDFVDVGLSNGVTYYYFLRTFDDLGNTAKSVVVNAIPEKAAEGVSSSVSNEEGQKIDEGEKQEIKSGETEEKETEDKETPSDGAKVSPFGIAILVLLVLLGVYLLYLQNPDAFSKLKFWKKSKNKNSNNSKNNK